MAGHSKGLASYSALLSRDYKKHVLCLVVSLACVERDVIHSVRSQEGFKIGSGWRLQFQSRLQGCFVWMLRVGLGSQLVLRLSVSVGIVLGNALGNAV